MFERFTQRHPSLFSRHKAPEITPRASVDESLGLRLIYEPDRVAVDVIFVHGLGGSSQKTWTNSQGDFWPRDWIPLDDSFGSARVHSFGYQAAVRKGEETVWDVNQFSKALLAQMLMSRHLRRADTPIILVAHSMGGLVIKQTYILACRDPNREDFARRIKSMVFLATPHGGSDAAGPLYELLRLTSGNRLYIADLESGSSTLQVLDREFSRVSRDLQLWSFYETRKMRVGLVEKLIVPQRAAVMGTVEERRQRLDADHRSICKFSSREDPNYVIVRGVLASIVGDLSRWRRGELE